MAIKKEDTPGKTIKGLALGASKSLGKITGGGTVEARRISSGTVFYWRHTGDGKTSREPIGAYDPKAPPESLEPTGRYGYSVKAAERAAERMAVRHAAELAKGSSYREAQVVQAAAQRADRDAKADRQVHTLQKLLDDYCEHLKALGRRSHIDASNIFKLHVVDAWPKIAGRAASEVTRDHVVNMQRRLSDAGKKRTANKLRAYMRAAYQVALDAPMTASIPAKFKGYAIEHNPITDTKRDTSADKADKNPLSRAEMQVYWPIIRDVTGIKGIALRLHLLTGGQRIAQLVAAKTAAVRDGAIELIDGKGRPGKGPRTHTVPLVGVALADVQSLSLSGEWLLSTDGGVTHIAATTLADWAQDLVGDKIKGFQAKRIRSGVETLLASVRVSREIRGHLQSHGVVGVQAAHYDGHDYLPEKTEALETLHRLLEDQASNVVEIRKAG
ncbi:MAG: integrase [Rhodoferax sp.]|nr:integrase [Rhodoferax sp.]